MGTGIAQRKRMSGPVAANHQWDFQHRGLVQLVAMHMVGRQRTVPEASEHQCIGGLALWKIEFGHGNW